MATFLKEFMKDGGPFMWVILMVFLTGLGLCLYKFFQLKKQDVNGARLFDLVKKYVLENNVEEALNSLAGSKSILAKILRSGLKRANEERQLVEDAVATSIMEHTPKITYQLNYISLIANTSTLIGLLGTIQGLIISFAGVGQGEEAKAEALASGIAKAMNTTAFGLISAIIIMALHTFLTSKAGKINDRIDEYSAKLIDLLSVKKKVN